MGDLIVGGLIALMVILILRSLHKAVAKSGACAFCSYAKNGCDHVGHHELDLERAESRLNATQKAIWLLCCFCVLTHYSSEVPMKFPLDTSLSL